MPSKCEITNFSCAVLPLVERKKEIVSNLPKEVRDGFDEADSNYKEDFDVIQKEIDSLSSSFKCLGCPHSSKLIFQKFEKIFEKMWRIMSDYK